MSSAAPNRTVLIVDDDPDLRESLAALLQAAGLPCVTAADGEEALVACAIAPPGLILMDIRMPGMGGIETCQALKGHPAWADIPVIALTAAEEPETEHRMREAGSILYVTKPFSPQRLLSAVRFALGAHSAEAAAAGGGPPLSGAGKKERRTTPEAKDPGEGGRPADAHPAQRYETEALLNLLVLKGIITRDEVLDEVKRLRSQARKGR
jgi:CheY-like chemotaxis protein